VTHASQELGTALGDVLFGDFNPGGKTTQTWPKSLDQLPPMMDYDIRHGRTYMYLASEPQYPFGHGLSYTTFSLARLATSTASLRLGAALTVSVDVANTSTRDGDEVVQLYARFPGSKVERPRKRRESPLFQAGRQPRHLAGVQPESSSPARARSASVGSHAAARAAAKAAMDASRSVKSARRGNTEASPRYGLRPSGEPARRERPPAA
jgi:hypothetical protein